MKASYAVNGVVKYNTLLDDGKTEAALADLERKLVNNESGFLPLDLKADFTPLEHIMPAQKLSACSFERIYFSRGSDCDIYQERKRLGEQLTPAIMKAIDGDVDHTVFSYIPNTAEVAYYGMTDGIG